MSENTYNSLSQNLKSWSENTNYPINNIENLINNFKQALTEVYQHPEIQNQTATYQDYYEIYNKIMLNPIFDSHPLEFVWHEDPKEFIEDINLLIGMAHNIFETIETKNAYLISLAVAFKKSAPKNLDKITLDEASEIIYETIFKIENPNFDNFPIKENIDDSYRHLTDGQALSFQIQYHRWMILNKITLPESSYMRNRFINIVIRKNFPKHTPNPENKSETNFFDSHAKLKAEITQHMSIDKSELSSDVLHKWINSFINNVMLVYYGFYKWDKLRGDFFKVIDLEKLEFGIKLPDQHEENQKEFTKYIDASK
jgi:hypothetical protein